MNIFRNIVFLFLAFTSFVFGQNTALYPGEIPGLDDLLVVTNNARDTLASGINSGATSIPLTDASEFFTPSAGQAGVVQIELEYIRYCGKSGAGNNTLVVCTDGKGGRGFDGSIAAGHSIGADVRDTAIAYEHNQPMAEIIALATSLGPVVTVAGLPPTPSDGDLARVTDGSTTSDCTVGGGSEVVVCIYDAGAVAWVAVSSGGGGGAPTDATYITQTPDATLSAEQALSVLSTGILKNTTGTGVLSIATEPDFPATLARDSELHNQAHAIDGADHTASGLTTGNVIRATGATTFAFQPLNFSDLSGAATDAQVPNTITLDNITQITLRAITDTTGDLPLGTRTSGNYVQDVADGTGIDGTASAEGATYTPTLDLTEINDHTFGDNTTSPLTQTFDPSGTTNIQYEFTDGEQKLVTGLLTHDPGITIQASETMFWARKGSVGTINAGDVVYISGYNAGTGFFEVELADADTAASMPAVGIASTTITNAAEGRVIENGEIANINTLGFTEGAEIYVSATAGAFTETAPTTEANLIQRIGTVLRAHVSAGVIQIQNTGITRVANLDSAAIFVGSAGNQAVAVDVTGDVTISNTGVTTVGADAVALGTDTTGGYAGSATEGGPATTALALDANGGNCAAGSYNLGVDASGAAEGCTDATTEIDSAIATHTSNASAHHTATVDTDTHVDIEENDVSVQTDPATLDFLGADFDLSTALSEVEINIAAALTRDTEWDTIAKIETATSYDFSSATNLDTGTVAASLVGADHIDAISEIDAAIKRGPDATDTHLLTTDVSAPIAKRCLEMDTDGSITLATDTCASLGPGGTTTIDALGDSAGAGTVAVNDDAQIWDWDSPGTAVAKDALTLNYTLDASSDAATQRILRVVRPASTGTETLEALVSLENLDTDGAVTSALEIRGAAGGVTTAIDANDTDITTILAVNGASITAADLAIIDDSLISLATEVTGSLTLAGDVSGAHGSNTVDDVTDATSNTEAADNNTTQVATTAFVQQEINGAGGTNLTCSGGVCNVDALVLADLPVGTANQLLKTNAGATAQEHATLAAEAGNEISVTFGVGTITLDVVEANLTLSAMGGAVTDAQVPDTITIDNATTAANLGADGVDALTEIAQGIKTAANDTDPLAVFTGGNPAGNRCIEINSSGQLVVATGDDTCANLGPGGTTTIDALGDSAGAGTVAVNDDAQIWNWDSPATAVAKDAFTLNYTLDATADAATQRILRVVRPASTGSATLEALLSLDNLDTDGAVTTGLEIQSAAGTITTAIDVSDAEIGTALAIGANDITTSGGTITQAELDILQDGLISLATEVTGNLTLAGDVSGAHGSNTVDDVQSATSNTEAADNNTTQVATTAFVQQEINGAGGTNLTCSAGVCNVDTLTLATHTDGNYVASITNGTGITGGDGGSEGAALTLAVNEATSFDWTGNHEYLPTTGILFNSHTAGSWDVGIRIDPTPALSSGSRYLAMGITVDVDDAAINAQHAGLLVDITSGTGGIGQHVTGMWSNVVLENAGSAVNAYGIDVRVDNNQSDEGLHNFKSNVLFTVCDGTNTCAVGLRLSDGVSAGANFEEAIHVEGWEQLGVHVQNPEDALASGDAGIHLENDAPIRMDEGGTIPTPPSTSWYLYTTSSGLALKDDAGTVHTLGANTLGTAEIDETATYVFSALGNTTWGSGAQVDLSAADTEIQNGTTPPATCNVGEIYVDTDQDTDGSMMICNTTNNWKDVDDDGGAGGFSSFIIDGDNTSPQTITDGNTASFLGGTNGIDTVAGVTDTITFNFDPTEVGAVTWLDNADRAWTFDIAAAGTNPVISFSSNTINVSTGALQVGGVAVDLDGHTHLEADVTDLTHTSVADGTGIDGTAAGGGVYTPTLDLTEINSTTFGDNTIATITHTVNPTGVTNPVWSYSDGVANLSTGALQVGGTAVLTAEVNDLSSVTNTLAVANGGTGATTLTGMLRGNGTGAFTALTSSTVGQVLRVTAADTFAWGALDLADTDAVTGILDEANLDTNVVLDNAANTWSTGAQSFASATSLTVPVAAGAAPTANGTIAYDSTANQLEYGDNGTNRVVANLDEAQTFTNKTLTTPTISSTGFTNAQHAHAAANSGGQLSLTAAVTGILPGANGGTGNGFFAVSGPATALKTFTFPNASATVLTTNAAVTVAQGGTGITSGTSGGVPYFSGTTTIASSAALTQNQLVIGGGAGAAPAALGAAGTTTQVLHGNAAGAPSFGAVVVEDVETALKEKFGCVVFENDGTALTATLDTKTLWRNQSASTYLLTEVECETDTGTFTMDLQRDDGTPADVVSNCACATTMTSCTVSGTEDDFAADNNLDLNTDSVSSATRVSICMKFEIQ